MCKPCVFTPVLLFRQACQQYISFQVTLPSCPVQVRALQGAGWQADSGRFRAYAAAALGYAKAQVWILNAYMHNSACDFYSGQT